MKILTVYFDKLEKICQSPDGPAGYLATVSEDHQLIKMLINSENFEMLIKKDKSFSLEISEDAVNVLMKKRRIM